MSPESPAPRVPGIQMTGALYAQICLFLTISLSNQDVFTICLKPSGLEKHVILLFHLFYIYKRIEVPQLWF